MIIEIEIMSYNNNRYNDYIRNYNHDNYKRKTNIENSADINNYIDNNNHNR